MMISYISCNTESARTPKQKLRVCHRKMVLQWESKLLIVNRRDQFFWDVAALCFPPRQCKAHRKLQIQISTCY